MTTSNVSGMWHGDRSILTVTESPFTFVNLENFPVMVFISGGTVSSVKFSRDAITFDNCGVLSGPIALNPNDRIEVVYALAPTIVYYPQ